MLYPLQLERHALRTHALHQIVPNPGRYSTPEILPSHLAGINQAII